MENIYMNLKFIEKLKLYKRCVKKTNIFLRNTILYRYINKFYLLNKEKFSSNEEIKRNDFNFEIEEMSLAKYLSYIINEIIN